MFAFSDMLKEAIKECEYFITIEPFVTIGMFEDIKVTIILLFKKGFGESFVISSWCCCCGQLTNQSIQICQSGGRGLRWYDVSRSIRDLLLGELTENREANPIIDIDGVEVIHEEGQRKRVEKKKEKEKEEEKKKEVISSFKKNKKVFTNKEGE